MKKFALAFLLMFGLSMAATADTEQDPRWHYFATVIDKTGKWDWFINLESIEIRDDDHPYLKKVMLMDESEDGLHAFYFYYFTDCTTDGYAMLLLSPDKDGRMIPKKFIDPTKINPGTISEFAANILCGKQKT